MGTKAALITGSARRIGRAIAMHLAGEGWDIAAHYNTSREEALSLQASAHDDLALRARRNAQERFSVEEMQRATLQVYERLLGL